MIINLRTAAIWSFVFLFSCFKLDEQLTWFCLLLVYDVTKRESFTNLAEVWSKEIESHSSNKDCIKMLVGNKIDKVLFGQSSYFFEKKSDPGCSWVLAFISLIQVHYSMPFSALKFHRFHKILLNISWEHGWFWWFYLSGGWKNCHKRRRACLCRRIWMPISWE